MPTSDDEFPYGRRLREAAMIRGLEDLAGNFDYPTIAANIQKRTGLDIDVKQLKSVFMGRTAPTLDVADAICKGMGIDALILFRD
jgi:hypothetical protein